MVSVLNKKVRPRLQVIQQISRWIGEGVLQPGEVLPSMQALGQQMGVSPATVLEALRELETEGFVRSLDNGQRAVIGFRRAQGTSLLARTFVILSDSDPFEAQAEYYPVRQGWAQAVDVGVLKSVRNTAMHLLAMRPSAITDTQIRHLINDPPCGLLVTPSTTEHPVIRDIVSKCRKTGTPVVFQAAPPDAPDGVDCIESDHEAGSYELTQWLIQQGCRRIQPLWARYTKHVTPRGWLVRREAGYARACRDAGLEVLSPLMIESEYNAIASQQEFDRDSFTLAGRLWEYLHGAKPVDAVLAISDGLALNATAACRILKREPNRDVLVAGYDNYWMDHPWRADAPPPAATVDKCNLRLGQEMVSLLEERIAGRLPAEPQIRFIPATLVVGEGVVQRPTLRTEPISVSESVGTI